MALYSRHHRLTAWSQPRTVAAWAADARRSVDYVTILQRIERGWSPEEAIATQPDVRLPQHLTLGGETKTIAAWARDPRCVPDVNTCGAVCGWAGRWPRRSASRCVPR